MSKFILSLLIASFLMAPAAYSMSCADFFTGGIGSSSAIPQNVSRISVKMKMSELVSSNPEFRGKVRKLQEMIANEPTQEAFARMNYVERRTYQDTRHGLEVQIVGALELNPVAPMYRNYMAQVNAGAATLDYVRGRTLDDTAHGYNVENVRRVTEMLRAGELGDLSQSYPVPKGPTKIEVEDRIKELAKKDSTFGDKLSRLKQMVINEPTEQQFSEMDYVQRRTYQDTRHGLTQDLIKLVGINPVWSVYRAYSNAPKADNGYTGRVLYDTAHHVDYEVGQALLLLIKARKI